jgi:hypothetical protein
MSYRNRDISGMGGALLVFLAWLALVTPLGIVYWLTIGLAEMEGVLEFKSYGWVGDLPTYRIVTTVIGVVHILICWILTFRLVRIRRWRTIRETIVAILITGPGLVLLDIGVTLILLRKSLDRIAFDSIPNALNAVVIPGLLICYLCMSRRVANTYPRPVETEQLAAVFD